MSGLGVAAQMFLVVISSILMETEFLQLSF